MADKKISELVSLAGKDVAATDFFPVVDVSVTETKSLTRDELRNAVNAIHFTATKALATTAAASLPDDTIIEVAADESLAGARTRYKVAAGALVFDYGVVTKADLSDASDPAKGAALVGAPGVEGSVRRSLDAQDYNVFKHFTVAQQADALTGAPVVDTTALINAALDAALAAGKRCVAYGTFRVSGTVLFRGDADFSQSTFLVYGAPPIAIDVSNDGAVEPSGYVTNCKIKLPKRTENMAKSGAGWTGQGVGIRVVNAQSCVIYLGNPVGFSVNALIAAIGAKGNSYNEYYIGHLENGKVNLSLQADAFGWVNENNFFGGRLSHYSNEGTNTADTRHIFIAASVNAVNNNLFIKPSIEGNTAEFHVECGGSQNTFLQARWEAASPKISFFGTSTNHGARNFILGGYGLQTLVVSYSGTTGRNNSLVGAAEQVIEMGASGKPLRYQNNGSSASAVRTIYGAGLDPWANGADWSVFESSQDLRGKRPADAYPRIKIDYVNGKIYFDNGTTAAPTATVGALGANGIAWTGTLYPGADATYEIGSTSYRWSAAYINKLVLKPSASVTPAANGDVVFETTSNNTLTIKVKGSDGVVRSGLLSLAVNTSATAAQIADKTHSINTTDKFNGREIWDSTNNRKMRASGATDIAAWWVVDGSASVTPA